MRRYVSNARSILNNGPTFQCVIWNQKTKSNVTIDVLIVSTNAACLFNHYYRLDDGKIFILSGRKNENIDCSSWT